MKKLAITLIALLLAACASVEYREPLNNAQKQSVRNGMTSAEVEQALAGPPSRTDTYRSGETVSSWHMEMRGMQGIRNAWFNVHYRDGKVVKTSESFDYLSMP